jgi:hypothetical protein
MLVQDNLGYIHQVPDNRFGQTVFDGLGNPVGQVSGILDFLNPMNLIQKGVQAVGNLLSPPPPPSPIMATPPPMAPGMSVPPPGGLPFPFPQFPAPPFLRPMMPARRCAPPVGWTTPALPYTGPGPRRMYMRCSVWPGEAGLVPGAPGSWTAPPWAPPTPPPGAPGFPGGGMGRRRRHFRRHR